MGDSQYMKAKDVLRDGAKAGFAKYREVYYGNMPWHRVFAAEFVATLFGGVGGALGLFLRSRFYPFIFAQAGRKVFFGRNVAIRHPHKIWLGNNLIIGDNCVIDAKGLNNNGLIIGDNVFIGRNTIISCKNGDIHIKKSVNISCNCHLVSSNKLTVGEGTMIGAYSYLLSGGEYDYKSSVPFAEQDGGITKGETAIGANCWIGARVTILDAACIGEHCVIGAGAVVTKPVEANSLAVGVPAHVVKSLGH